MVLLAVVCGVTAVLLAAPALRLNLVVAAAGYTLWLACRLATAGPLAVPAAADRRPSFVAGAVLGVINPKDWIAIAAVFASARLADSTVADATLKVLLLALMVVLDPRGLAARRRTAHARAA